MKATAADLVQECGRFGEGADVHIRLNVIEDEEGVMLRVGLVSDGRSAPVQSLDHIGAELDLAEAVLFLDALKDAIEVARRHEESVTRA